MPTGTGNFGRGGQGRTGATTLVLMDGLFEKNRRTLASWGVQDDMRMFVCVFVWLFWKVSLYKQINSAITISKVEINKRTYMSLSNEEKNVPFQLT